MSDPNTRVTADMLAAAEDIARAIDPSWRHQFLDLLRAAQKVVAGMLDRPVFHEHYAWREVVSATRATGAGVDGARMHYINQLCLAVVRGDHESGSVLHYPCINCGRDTTEPLFGSCDDADCVASRGPLISEHPDGRYATYDEVRPFALSMTDDDARRLIATMREQVGEESGS